MFFFEVVYLVNDTDVGGIIELSSSGQKIKFDKLLDSGLYFNDILQQKLKGK